MTTVTTDIKRALSAEMLKVKRSPLLVTVIVLPALIITMIVLVIPFLFAVAAPEVNPDNPWMDLTTNMLETWNFLLVFVVPLVLVTSVVVLTILPYPPRQPQDDSRLGMS